MKRKLIYPITPIVITSLAMVTSSLIADDVVKPAEKPTKEKILHQITIEKLDLELEKTPVYSFSNATNKKVDNSKRWLEIEAKLDVNTLSEQKFLSTLDATFTLVYKQHDQKYYKLERTLTFKNVNIEKGEVLLVAYIDPDTLEHITGEKRPALNDLTGVAVTISTNNLSKLNPKQLYKSVLIDRKIKASEKTLWWQSTAIKSSDQNILSLGETPFFQARPNRYPRVQKQAAVAKK